MSTQISCPFCNQKIVEAYELEDSYNSETEEYKDIQDDYSEGKCPHLAFISDWAYAGSQIENNWLNEMTVYSHLLDAHYDKKITIESIKKIKKQAVEESAKYANLSPIEQDKIKHQIAEFIIENEDYAQELLAKTFIEHETHLEIAFIDKGDGVGGCGGPTYMCIFLKKKI